MTLRESIKKNYNLICESLKKNGHMFTIKDIVSNNLENNIFLDCSDTMVSPCMTMITNVAYLPIAHTPQRNLDKLFSASPYPWKP